MTTIQNSFFYCLLLSLWQRLSALWEESAARQVCLRIGRWIQAKAGTSVICDFV